MIADIMVRPGIDLAVVYDNDLATKAHRRIVAQRHHKHRCNSLDQIVFSKHRSFLSRLVRNR